MYPEEPKKKVYIDEDLFEKISLHDKDAFQDLYELSYRSLYAFLLTLTQNADDAQDLLQDTFVQIYKKANLYKRQGNPMAWMMTIARNLFLMNYRRETQIQKQSYEEIDEMLGTDHLENVEDQLLIRSIITSLDLLDREIVVLHIVQGLTFQEIAKITGKPVGTILARYHRCMKKLQKEHNVR